MKSREISPRAVAITGIFVVLICIGFYLYLRQDTKSFQASLTAAPTQAVNTPGATGDFTEDVIDEGFSETTITEEPAQTTPETTEERVEALQNTAGGATEEAPACEMSEGMMEPEPEDYAGMTVPEVRSLLQGLSNPNVENLDDKLSQLEQVLIDRLGADPKIPQLIDTLSAAYTLIERAQQANATGGDNLQEVNTFLDFAPVVVTETLIETSIELLQPSEAEAARGRAIVERLKENVDTLQLYRDMIPIVDDAIMEGDLGPEEGAAFLESLGDNISVEVDYEFDDTIPTEEASPPKPIGPENENFFND